MVSGVGEDTISVLRQNDGVGVYFGQDKKGASEEVILKVISG